MMRRMLIPAAILLLCVSVVPASAAEVTLAQFSWDTANGSVIAKTFYPNYYMMQTFTTETAGTVGSVDVTIQQVNENTTAGLTAKIYALSWRDGGLQPTGSPLSTGALDATDPQFDNIFAAWKQISMSPVALASHVTYGLVVYAGGTNSDYQWVTKDNNSDMYVAGEHSISTDGVTFAYQPDDDVCFRVNTPEPATMATLLTMGAGLIVRRRTAR